MIRKASPEDAEGILRVINEANKQAYREIIPSKHFREPVITEGELLEMLREKIFYIYMRGGEIKGVAALLLREDESGVMDWVYVLPRYQRSGIGTALVNRLEDEVKERGLEKLMLKTPEKARWAVEFYLKLGYRIIDRISTSWGYDVVMEKKVASANS